MSMNLPIYGPDEMVRLELLAYRNPEGLHPVEENWRDLARKLLQHTKELQSKLDKVRGQIRFDNELKDWRPMRFPEPFTEVRPAKGDES